jgi:hypothetical protein
MSASPQVALFGSIGGEWRERYVIPVLIELGVTYYNPVRPSGWTRESGDIEADRMARCETVVMVFNRTLPAFTALAETGWAALGCVARNQNFILQIDLDCPVHLSPALASMHEGEQLERRLQHSTTSSRYMVYKHARAFQHPRLHLVEDVAGVAAKLRELYPSRAATRAGTLPERS